VNTRSLVIVLAGLAAFLGAATATQAAVSYVSSSVPALSSSASSSITLTAPSPLVTGQFMVAFISVNSTSQLNGGTLPAGWTTLLIDYNNSNVAVGVFYRVATSADVAGTSSYTWTLNPSARVAGGILAFSGVSSVSAIVDSGKSDNTTASTSYTAPSVIPGVANTMLVALYGIGDGNGTTLSAPAAMSQAFGGSTGAGPNGVQVGAFYGAWAAATATGTRVSIGNSSTDSIGVSLALQAASAGATHFLITTSNYGLFCLSQAVTVTALDAGNNPVPSFSGTITLSTTTGLGNWSLTSGGGTFQDISANDGLATYAFPGTQAAATFALSYTSGSAVVTVHAAQSSPTVINDDGTQGAITFSPSGFTVTSSPFSNPAGGVPAFASREVAGSAFSLYLTAYGQSPTSATCGIITSYAGTKNLKFWSTYINPATGSVAATVNAAAIATAEGSAAAQSVVFASGQAIVTAKYKDAGSLSLSMKDDTTGNPGLPTGIRGSTGPFVSVPANFVVTNIKRSSDGFLNPGASAPAPGAVFIAAGQPFTATVTAAEAGGVTTPNFGRESTPESVKFTATLVLPLSGNDPVVSGTAGTFTGGIATGTAFSWPEVGVVTLVPHVADGNYLATGDVVGSATANVGRFIPNAFSVAFNTPMFGTGCSAGNFSFTYVGQPITYPAGGAPVVTATAKALGGTTTQNYTGTSLFRLSNSSLTGRTYTPTPSTQTLDLSGLPAASGDPLIGDVGGGNPIAVGAGSGTLTFSAGNGIKYVRGAAVPPFSANIALSVNVIDLDGAAAANPVTIGAGSGIAFSTGVIQRYGRLALRNSVGSELLDLPTSLTTQYYFDSTRGFTTNTDDLCTAAPTLTFSNYQPNLALNETCVRDSGSPGASGIGCAAAAAAASSGPTCPTATPATPRYRSTANCGDFNLVLSAPGSGNNGAVTVMATAPTWLQYSWFGNSNPTAMATFGLFPGPASRVHQREVY
jgi:MSHA biogenesis protein MshQ